MSAWSYTVFLDACIIQSIRLRPGSSPTALWRLLLMQDRCLPFVVSTSVSRGCSH